MWMYVIDLIEGNVSEEDKKLMKESLLKITRGETRLYGVKKSTEKQKVTDKKGKQFVASQISETTITLFVFPTHD